MPLPQPQRPPPPAPPPAPPAYDPRNPLAHLNPPTGAGAYDPRNPLTNPYRPPEPIQLNADQTLADLTQQQYQDYLKRYRPVEQKYAAMLRSDNWANGQVNRAGINVNRAFANSAEIEARERARYGVTGRQGQEQTLNRMREIGRTMAVTGAKNDTAVALDDLKTQGQANMIGYGRNLVSSATAGLGGVANRAAQRDSANDQMDAQQDAQQMGLIGTGAGVALMATGPVGWTAGAGLMLYGMFG